MSSLTALLIITMSLGHILAVILSVVDYFTEGIFIKTNAVKARFISFSAGISIAYIFLVLLPEIYTRAIAIHNALFIPILLSFSIFHLLEKYIMMNFMGVKLRREHMILHSSTAYVHFFVVGYILVKVAEISPIAALLLFIPVCLHTVIESLPRQMIRSRFYRAFSAAASILGALVATFTDIGEAGNVILLSIVGGAILYTIIRESLPKERKGRPAYFLLGMVVYLCLVLLLWSLGF